jgi:sortase A
VAGALCIGHAAFLPAKALVGQAMMAHAWMRAQDGEARAKPWPWADTWPVARLSVPAHDVALTVLRGAQGESLAWGPGHVDGTALPGFAGNAAVGGHRDTSFRFLKDVSVGERVVVERPDGEKVTYEVTDAAVMNEKDTRALSSSPGRVLTLITCYPFDTPVPGGPLRYVVRAVEAS